MGRVDGLYRPPRGKPGGGHTRDREGNEIDDRPVVIDFRTDSMEQVFPMVPAGASNDDIVVYQSQGTSDAEALQ